MKATIIGTKKVTGKDGKESCTYYIERPFKDSEVGNGALAVGMVSESYWSRKIFDVKPGDKVNISFEPGYQNAATLEEITVIK